MYMKSNTGEIEVFLCPEYNTNTTSHQPQSQLRPYSSQVSVVINVSKDIEINFLIFLECQKFIYWQYGYKIA